jgi:hypothetical protein
VKRWVQRFDEVVSGGTVDDAMRRKLRIVHAETASQLDVSAAIATVVKNGVNPPNLTAAAQKLAALIDPARIAESVSLTMLAQRLEVRAGRIAVAVCESSDGIGHAVWIDDAISEGPMWLAAL